MHCGDDFKASRAPVSTPIQDFKPSNKTKKDKKKKQHKNRKDLKDFATPATRVNTAKVGDKKRKKKKNKNEVMYFNCNKKGHYVNKCRKSQKSKN